MYGCTKCFLQSSHIPPKLKQIELAYTYPAHDLRGGILDEMGLWMSGGNSEWCLNFPGETWATKKEIEDSAVGRGVVLLQMIDENYLGENVGVKVGSGIWKRLVRGLQ